LQFIPPSRAEWRAPIGALLIGAGLGLGLGAGYLAAGMGERAAEHAHALALREAAADSYAEAFETFGRPEPIVVAANTASKAARKPTRARELDCLAEAVYYEARGEDPQGQYAVAQVVMNRVHHPAFPKTVCGVVYQGAGHRGCQFSFACDGSRSGRRREASAWTRARRVAARALSGVAVAEIGSATHFHTTGVAPAWGPQMRRVAQVGMHIFYRFNPRRPAGVAPALAPEVTLAAGPSPDEALRIVPTLVETAVEAAPAAEPAQSEAKPAAGPAEAAMKSSQPTGEAAS
jgi:spore germination cell wall hydrolase CwlJ-like protein